MQLFYSEPGMAVKDSKPVPRPDATTSDTSPAGGKKGSQRNRAASAAAQWVNEPEILKAFAALSRNITAARNRQNMTLTKLAIGAGLPVSTVFAAESGTHNISLATLLRIASSLNVEAGTLLPTKNDEQIESGGSAISKIVEGCLEAVLSDQRATSSRIEQTLKYINSLQPPLRPKP